MIPQFDIKHYALGFVLLAVLLGCTTEAERRQMRAGLDSINVLNRTDQPFTPDDVRPYVDFFDKEAKAFFTLLPSDSIHNDQLLAHYLLGRAYHEKGDAPMALESYQHAIDHADTTSASCDYRQLSRVYAQMAEIFYQQSLYREQLEHNKQSVKFAQLGHDTIAALMSYEQEYIAYKKLGNPDSAIYIIENVASLCNQYGKPTMAAITLGTIVRTLIEKGLYAKAYRYMTIYETRSGLFNDKGEIVEGREYYYRVKGLYFLKTGILDSAEYYFRKELNKGTDFNNQNAGAMGLAELYQQKNQPDSVAKYALYSYAMNDSSYARTTTETIERMQTMYNYSQHQEEARKEREIASKRLIYIWLTLAVILFLTIILCIIIILLERIKNKRKSVEAEYCQSLKTIEQANKELELLRKFKEQNKNLIIEKEKLIQEQDKIRKLILKKEKSIQEVALQQFKTTNIYQRFLRLSDSGKQPSKEEWTTFQDAIFEAYPNFSELMTAHCQELDDREYKTCVLIRADFKPTTVSSMLGVLPSVITQLRSNLYFKLFLKHGSSREFDALIKKIY